MQVQLILFVSARSKMNDQPVLKSFPLNLHDECFVVAWSQFTLSWKGDEEKTKRESKMRSMHRRLSFVSRNLNLGFHGKLIKREKLIVYLYPLIEYTSNLFHHTSLANVSRWLIADMSVCLQILCVCRWEMMDLWNWLAWRVCSIVRVESLFPFLRKQNTVACKANAAVWCGNSATYRHSLSPISVRAVVLEKFTTWIYTSTPPIRLHGLVLS
jgi:hypothetical protein